MRGVIDWNAFSLGTANSIRFNNGQGITLNEVTGANMSNILGSLSATGSVYIINPNGILIGSGARVDTGGDFIGSTLKLPISDFMQGGSLLFKSNATSYVANLGHLYSQNGSIFLIGGRAANDGSIHASNGEAGIAAGGQVLLKESNGDQRIFVQTPAGDVNNGGIIEAAQVEVKTKGGNIYALAGNNGGVIQATGTKTIGGQVWLIADGGTTNAGGTISATNADKSLGHVETSGEFFRAEPGLNVQANWLTDPTDLTIDSTLAAAIINTLNTSGDYTATTSPTGGGNGDILVNSLIQWTSNATLTLSAYRNISLANGVKIINGCPPGTCATLVPAPSGGLILRADNSATGTGTLLFGNSSSALDWRNSSGNITLYYDPTGTTKYNNFSSDRTSFLSNILMGTGSFSTYMLVNNTTDLNNVNQNLSANFALGADINASSITTSNFTPIGGSSGFSGNFNGLGQIIDGFHYSDSTYSGEGLFTKINSGATVQNIGLTNGDVSSANVSVGMLAGSNQGTISNVWVQGRVTGTGGISNTGGLVGSNQGTVLNASADVLVSGPGGSSVGGMSGINAATGTIDYSYSKGVVSNGDPFATVSSGSTETNDYFDRTTSGLTTSASAASGVSHGSLSSLPSGFSSSNWGVAGVSDLYLKSIFKTAPGAVNGSYYTSQGGAAATNVTGYVVANGGNTYLAPYEGSDGSFALLTRPSITGAFGYTTAGISANSYMGTNGSNPFGPPVMNFYNNTVTIASGTSSSGLSGDLGGLASLSSGVPVSDLLFTIGTGNSSLSSSKDLSINANRGFRNYSLDVPVTTTENLYLTSPLAYSLTQSSPVTANGLVSNGQVTLTNTSNFFNTLAGTGLVSASIYDQNSLSIGTVGSVTGYNGQYTSLQTAGNLTLNAAVGSSTPSNGSTPSIRLIDGGTFTNNVGSGALMNTSGTSNWAWQIWSRQPANDNLNGLYWNYKQYNASYGVTTPQGAITASGVLYTQLPYLNVALTGPIEKTYDSTNAAYVGQSSLSSSGYVGGDTQDQLSGTGSYTDIHAGTGKSVTINSFSVTATNAGRPVYGYQTNSVINSNSGIIDPAPLSFQINGVGKTYDGTTADPGASAIPLGLQGSDSVALGGVTFVFDSKDVAPQGSPNFGQRNISAAGTPFLIGQSGTLGSDYVLQNIYQDQQVISPAPITIPVSAVSKNYDGTNLAQATLGSVVKLNGADDVSVSGNVSATFSDQHAGNNKTVTVDDTQLTLNGNDAGDYYIASGSVTGLANIYPLALTATLNSPTKTFDNTNSATVTMGALQGVLPLDAGNVTAGGSPVWTYAQSNVGSGIPISQTGFSLSGPAAGDYTLSSLTTSGSITPAPITATLSANNKVYDTTTAATGMLTLGSGVAGAPVSIGGNGTMTFASANAGNGITVTDSGATLSGANAGNYSLTVLSGAANITRAPLTLAVTGANKTYDSTTADPGASSALTGVYASDAANVTLTGTAAYTFTSPHAGSPTVTESGLSLAGSAANNYSLSVANGSATIAPAPLTASVTVIPKTFDNTTSASASYGALQGVLPADSGNVTVTGSATWNFASANAGTGIPVSQTGLSLTGSAANDYTLATLTGAGTINPAPITATLSANNKVYDTATAATGMLTLASGVAGAPVSIGSNGTMAFASANAGNGITVTDTGATLSGANAGNYSLTVASGAANITRAPLTLGVTGANKTYDSTTADPGASSALTGVYASDAANVTLTGTAAYTFTSPHAGSPTVTESGLSLAGSAANNYSLSVANGSATIAPAPLTASVTVIPKTFDNTTSASASYGALQGVLPADTGNVTVTGSATWNFVSANAGTGIPVSQTGLSLAGSAAGDYTLATLTGAGTINPAPITATLSANNKVYDTTTSATGLLTLGAGVAGAPVSIGSNGTMTFASANAGNGITVTDSGATLSGANAGNYSLTVTSGAANITPAPLTLAFIPNNLVYNGTTSTTASLGSLSGVLGGQNLSYSGPGTFNFNSPNAGSSTVTASGITLTGPSASNYTLSLVQAGAASVTPAPVTVPFTPGSITYNGGTATTATLGSLSGILPGQNVTLSGAGSFNFASPNAGSATVTGSGLSLTGPGASNYMLNLMQVGSASIAPATVTLPFTPNSITYNGGTSTTATLGSLTGILPGQNLTIAGAGSFNFTNPSAGSTTVTGSGFSLAGPGASNYTLNLQQVGSASITAAPLTYTPTVSGTTASRSFGQPNPTFSGTVTGLVNGAALSSVASGNPTFTTTATAQSAPGTYAVTGSGLTITNPNYVLTQAAPSATTTFAVQPLQVSIGSLTRQAGQANPIFSISYSGPSTPYLQQILSSLTLVSNAPTADTPGVYQITAAIPSNLAGAIIIHPGTLTITPAGGTILSGIGVGASDNGGGGSASAAALPAMMQSSGTAISPATIPAPSATETIATPASVGSFRITIMPQISLQATGSQTDVGTSSGEVLSHASSTDRSDNVSSKSYLTRERK